MSALPPRTRALLSGTVAGATVVAIGVALLAAAAPASADPSVGLGTATSFAVLAASKVKNTGATDISGDVGVKKPGTVEGLTSAMVRNGTIHQRDATAASAQADLSTAYNDVAARSSTPVAVELGGHTFDAGVYSNTTLGLTGTVTLDAQGKPDAVFVFQTASTLTTATASRVALINGASACNVFWQVGSSATLGTGTAFVGSILAQASITVTTLTSVQGRLLARTGAVTLDHNTITRPSCAAPGGSSTSSAPTTSAPTTSTPTTSTPTTSTPTSSTPTSSTPTGGPTSTVPTVTPSTSSPSSGRSAPTVATVSPSSGPVGASSVITVTGTGFVPGATSVTVGGTTVPARDVRVLSPTSLTFVAPARPAGAALIVIRTASGSSTQRVTLTYASVSSTPTSTTTLATTGSPDLTLLAGAALLVLGGLTVLLAGRRRVIARHRR